MFSTQSGTLLVRLSLFACLLFQFSLADQATPTAVSVPVRTSWVGDDGIWSPVSIRVGTPPQWVDVLVSTASQETWVIGPDGCLGSQVCERQRGGLFRSNMSSTWQFQGISDLGLDPNLDFSGKALYGYDNISLSDQISVPYQTIGIVNTTDYLLGFLGLGIEPTNFTEVNVPSFLDSMVHNKSYIPSHSYGFTAGAWYSMYTSPSSRIELTILDQNTRASRLH